MAIWYYVHYRLLQLSLYKIKLDDLSFFFSNYWEFAQFSAFAQSHATAFNTLWKEKKTKIIPSNSAVDIISLSTLFALYFLDSFKHHLSHRKTNQRRHNEMAQVPFMTEGKVQILVNVSFWFSQSKLRIVFSVLWERRKQYFFFSLQHLFWPILLSVTLLDKGLLHHHKNLLLLKTLHVPPDPMNPLYSSL